MSSTQPQPHIVAERWLAKHGWHTIRRNVGGLFTHLMAQRDDHIMFVRVRCAPRETAIQSVSDTERTRWFTEARNWITFHGQPNESYSLQAVDILMNDASVQVRLKKYADVIRTVSAK